MEAAKSLHQHHCKAHKNLFPDSSWSLAESHGLALVRCGTGEMWHCSSSILHHTQLLLNKPTLLQEQNWLPKLTNTAETAVMAQSSLPLASCWSDSPSSGPVTLPCPQNTKALPVSPNSPNSHWTLTHRSYLGSSTCHLWSTLTSRRWDLWATLWDWEGKRHPSRD